MTNAKTLKKPLAEKVCKRPECAITFSPYRSWQDYCSPRCRSLHYWETHEVVKTDQGPQVVQISVPVAPAANADDTDSAANKTS